ncbi:nucleolar protein 9 [Hetaerina americana]|uniref:nucleolar protein 9 n=1 Tax=Hetaerina americana TaxID=62018 RepID=UPI003A7F2BFD
MDAPSEQHGKRKRKKSFLQKAKSYGKKGKFGRGTHVSEDVYQYFVRVLEMSRQDFSSEDDKEVFVNNAFDETVGEEINLSCNQLVSRAIETLLPSASTEVIQRFTKAFSQDLRPLFGDPFASHVLQKLLLIVAKQTKDSLVGKGDSSGVKDDWVIRVGRFALNNLEDFAWDTYANHVIRTVLLCTSGGKESDNMSSKGGVLSAKSMEELKSECELPTQYVDLLKDYHRKLKTWPQIGDMAFEGVTSGLVQSLLFALKRIGDTASCDDFVQVLIKECFKKYGNGDEELFECDYSLHVLDSALATGSTDVFKKIFEECLQGKIAKLAIHNRANFTIQRLFDFCPDKEMLEVIFDEILEADGGLSAIFSSGYFGVFTSISRACKRLGHKQGVFIQNLMKALDCYQPEGRQVQFVPLCLQMVAFKGDESKEATRDKLQVNLHGSLIIQAMLHFNKPIKVINSLLEMKPPDLQEIFCDPKGSHIMDAFMESKYIGAKSRERLFRWMMGTYVAMATSKHGSRSMEAAWKQMTVKFRQTVAGELSARESQLLASPFGRIIAVLAMLSLYRRSVEEWRQVQTGEEKKREIFSDIIGVCDEPTLGSSSKGKTKSDC